MVTEKKKYTDTWEHDDYRKFSPAERFCQLMPEVIPGRLIDWGTGTGRQALAFHKKGFQVTMVDIADNCLDDEVQEEIGDKLLIQTLWDPVQATFDYGVCCDVMEHLPTEYVVIALKNMILHSKHTFFSISNTSDDFGQIVGYTLHLTVKPFVWWRDLLRDLLVVEDARDVQGNSVFWVRRDV